MRSFIAIALAAALLVVPPGAVSVGAEMEASQAAKRLTLKQVADDGDITVTKLDTGDFQVSDGAGLVTLPTRPTLVIKLLDGSTSSLTVQLDAVVEVDLLIDLGDGPRHLSFAGDQNSVGRDLRTVAGKGSQVVDLAVDSGLVVGRHLRIDLGADLDTVHADDLPIVVGGNVRLAGVNVFDSQAFLGILGALEVTVKKESLDSSFDIGGSFLVEKSFRYVGSSGADEVFLRGAPVAYVERQATIDLGRGLTTSGKGQKVDLQETLLNGKLVIRSGDSTNGDSVTISDTTAIVGPVQINLGDGPNEATLRATFEDSSVRYVGGDGVDHLTYGMTEAPANLRAQLAGGDDVLTLEAGAVLKNLWVDFGDGSDAFENLLGALPPGSKLLHLP